MDKILVTGTSGRMGGLLAQTLLKKNYKVIGFDMKASDIKHVNYKEFTQEVTSLQKINEVLQGVKIIYHLGAFMSWLEEDKEAMWKANVESTRMLLEASIKNGVKRFIFGSTGEVYPDNNPVYLPIDEKHSRNPNTSYGLTKKIAEDLVLFYQVKYGLKTVIMRFSHTQNASELLDKNSFFSGPRFFIKPKIEQQRRFGNMQNVTILEALDADSEGLVISANEQGRPFKMNITDTRDIIEGLLLALEHPEAENEIFNLGYTKAVDFDKAIEYMAHKTKLPFYKANFPGQGVYYSSSNEKIRKKLNYAPVWDIEQMIDEAFEVWKAQKN